MSRGVINGKGQGIAFDESNEKSKGEKGNQVPKAKTTRKANQSLLKGEGGTVLGQFFRPTGVFLFHHCGRLIAMMAVTAFFLPAKDQACLVQGTRRTVTDLIEKGGHGW